MKKVCTTLHFFLVHVCDPVQLVHVMTTHTTPQKIRAGSYRLGNLIVTKQEPTSRGGTTTWRNQRGKLIGYSLGDVTRLVNTFGSVAYDLANGTKHHPLSVRF